MYDIGRMLCHIIDLVYSDLLRFKLFQENEELLKWVIYNGKLELFKMMLDAKLVDQDTLNDEDLFVSIHIFSVHTCFLINVILAVCPRNFIYDFVYCNRLGKNVLGYDTNATNLFKQEIGIVEAGY